MTIPVQNIYYLLTYAWRDFSAGDLVDVESLDEAELVDLFAHVLSRSTRQLLRRGLKRDYQTFTREIAGVRGQVDFAGSINKMLFQQGKAQCRVDELTVDVPENRLLAATITRLKRVPELDGELRDELAGLQAHFRDVSDLPRLNPLAFHRVQLKRNDRYYRLLLHICELVARNLLLGESAGDTRFRDVLREDVDMPMLFERFVRNFYDHELPEATARAEHIRWDATPANPAAEDALPIMKTDTTLRTADGVLVIDTKYTKKTLESGRFGESIKTGNLYQIFAYLQNFAATKNYDGELEGMLLYPVVDEQHRLEYDIHGHRLRVCTVDLAQEWRGVEEELLGLVKS